MNQQASLGLQWKLAVLYVAASLLSSGTVALGYYAFTYFGLSTGQALAAGVAAGLAAGLVVSYAGLQLARSMKHRLWEAGDMATRIARGDFAVRLPLQAADEIGALEGQLNEMAGHLQRAVAELSQLAEQNRRLAEEAGRGAAVEERARLARDLHDTVNQQLFVLAMRAAAARKRLEKAGGEAAEALGPELAMLEELARGAHGEARQLILQLRPTTLEQQGLGPALAEYLGQARETRDLEVVADIDQEIRLGGKTGENLFRVAQEALNNIHKHARARSVQVTLSRDDDGAVVLRIKDDGKGFDTRSGVRPTAVGLVGMQERVAALGGTFRIRTAPDQGTEIAVTLPATQ